MCVCVADDCGNQQCKFAEGRGYHNCYEITFRMTSVKDMKRKNPVLNHHFISLALN